MKKQQNAINYHIAIIDLISNTSCIVWQFKIESFRYTTSGSWFRYVTPSRFDIKFNIKSFMNILRIHKCFSQKSQIVKISICSLMNT